MRNTDLAYEECATKVATAPDNKRDVIGLAIDLFLEVSGPYRAGEVAGLASRIVHLVDDDHGLAQLAGAP